MSDQPNWSLSADKRTAYVDFPTTPPARFAMDADSLDELIDTLGKVRMDMDPPIAMDDEIDPGSRLSVATLGRWRVEPVPDGSGIAIALLHPGLRWVALLLSPEATREMAQTMIRVLPLKSQAGDRGR